MDKLEQKNQPIREESIRKTGEGNLKARKIVYYLLGVLEVLLAFRLAFKLLGANAQSSFVSFIYSVSQAFLSPFSGIFQSSVTKGFETRSILEPTTIIAMIVYAVIGWGIVKLIEISKPRENNEIR